MTQMLSSCSVFTESSLPLSGKESGKVRDWYRLGDGKRLIVTTDRLSAFDKIIGALPYKGQVLNELSLWWFENTRDIVRNHVISSPDPNAIVAHEVTALPIEVIVRGYITGVTSTALWYRYSLGERNIYGYDFPDGLTKNARLPEAIITPTTKGGASGHDERLTCSEVVTGGYLSEALWERVRNAALALFARGQERAYKAGLILVDTKYEFGLDASGELMLIDEVHTPDSSRYWKQDSYADRLSKHLEPENYDKEFIRLAFARFDYRGDGEPPVLPESVLNEAALLYQSVYEKLTGSAFKKGSCPVEERLLSNVRKAGLV